MVKNLLEQRLLMRCFQVGRTTLLLLMPLPLPPPLLLPVRDLDEETKDEGSEIWGPRSWYDGKVGSVSIEVLP